MSSTLTSNATWFGSKIRNACARVEKLVSGLRTVTSRGPAKAVLPMVIGMLMMELPVKVMGPLAMPLTAPPGAPADKANSTVEPAVNLLPVMSRTAVPPWTAGVRGTTADSAGSVTPKASALLTRPFTPTTTGPSTAPVGTVTMRVSAAVGLTVTEVTETVTWLPPVPVKVTLFSAAMLLKPSPVICTGVPRRALGGLRLEIVGGPVGGGGGLGFGPSATMTVVGGSWSTTTAALVEAPPSGLVMVTVRAVSAAVTATSTSTMSSVSEL